MVRDQVDELRLIIGKQRNQMAKLSEECRGSDWLIKEKDTELRVLNKERDLM